jgi:hypothetical protein
VFPRIQVVDVEKIRSAAIGANYRDEGVISGLDNPRRGHHGRCQYAWVSSMQTHSHPDIEMLVPAKNARKSAFFLFLEILDNFGDRKFHRHNPPWRGAI